MAKMYYQNIKGMRRKAFDIYISVACNNYVIVCLCETWLDDFVLSSELFYNRYVVIRRETETVHKTI